MTCKLVPKAYRDLADRALQQGWEIRLTGKGHTQWLAPDKEHIVTCGKTPSDHRAIHNMHSRLRRYGLK